MQLTEKLAAFIDPILEMCAGQFPRKCTNCGKEFSDFKHFIRSTTPVGAPQCSGLEDDPLWLLSYVNCTCGSTIVLACADPAAHARFKQALEEESLRTKIPKKELLKLLREEIRRRMLE